MVEEYLFVWVQPELNFDVNAFAKHIESPGEFCYYNICASHLNLSVSSDKVLETVINHLQSNDSDVGGLKTFTAEIQVDYAKIMSLMRLCLTNKKMGPPVGEIRDLLGHDKFIAYLKHALNYIRQTHKQN